MSPLLSETEQVRLVETRRDLHAHPELAYDEQRTAGVVVERLETAGYLVERLAETGVVARLKGEGSKTVLLRADMDALPVTEQNEVPYRSQHPGRMHACGHDGHTAALLTVAERLAGERLAGDVLFCFQPAEEGRGGAARMIEEGVLAGGVDAVFGVHLWNNLPVGKVGLASGPIMAAVDAFEIHLTGRGGHGAMPHQTADPVVAACQIVGALQTIVSRNTSPLDSCVVTVGQVEAGENFNVIPGTARLSGTCRAFSREMHERLPEQVRRVAAGVAAALGCEARVEYRRVCKPTVNEPACTALLREVAAELLGPEAVVSEGDGARTMTGEDFSEFLEQAPGCFALVGSSNPARGLVHPHHSAWFDFDEGALPIAARLLEGAARKFLGT